jgi:surface protein with Ig-like domain/phospholipase/carboxylesterase
VTYTVKLSITSFSVNKQINLSLKALALFAILLSLSGCNDSEGRPCARTEDACIIEEPQPVEAWWDVPIPDFSENPDRPDVTILGERTVILNLGEFYLEQGALASDDQDGNITPQIVIKGEVNTDIAGDYLLRYTVTDTSGLDAIEKVRIIRVIDEIAAPLTRRPLGTTTANFGYFEHLPLNYGQLESMNSSPMISSNNKPPLIIYLHGSGGNLEFVQDTDPYTSLDAVLENNGIPRLISDGLWNDNLPFVVVAPHLGAVPGFGYKDRLDAFVEYAIRAYDIDTNRVYMTGWSSGGYLSSAYAVDFPDKIAAIAPIASGLSTDIENLPSDFCNIEQVPVWLFHGTGDQITPFVNSINAYNAILDKCSARVLPKLSLLMNARHHMHHVIFDLSALAGSVIDDITVEYDPRYDPYEPDIYEWLLSHSLEDR